jgi:uncharacterized protein YcbX
MLTLSEINIYPVKSLGGISLQSSLVEERGLKYDRRWMLVDEKNKFITQRAYPQMALLKVILNDNGLLISCKNTYSSGLIVPFDYKYSETKKVIIWNDVIDGFFYDDKIDKWFSDSLGIKCRLVYMSDSAERKVHHQRADDKKVSFADAYPFLIIGQSSLDDLNSRMEKPLPMNRFRTNFVFTGGEPFEEDNWKKLKIGELTFEAVKPCARCVITTTDQETAERAEEPLFTLSKFRKVNTKVMFGMNLICESTGKINLGDEINLL